MHGQGLFGKATFGVGVANIEDDMILYNSSTHALNTYSIQSVQSQSAAVHLNLTN